MKRRRDKKSAIDIDLTSMLDVIFILLMVLMCNQAMATEEARGDLDYWMHKYDVEAGENGTRKDQIDKYENANEYVQYVTVYANYEVSNPKTRHIRIAYNNEEAINDIEITPTTQNQAYESFVSEITNFIEDNESTPIILTLNEDQILYRDQKELYKKLQELSETHNNLYSITK